MKTFYKTLLLLFLNSSFLIFNSFSQQAPGIEWQNTIGGNSSEFLYCIEQTTDGGYILGGFSFSDSSGDKTENSMGLDDYWIVKIDSIGAIQWQNTISGDDEDLLSCIHQTADGGYIVGGHSNSDISGDKTENSIGAATDYWVVKIDSSGNIQWQNTIGGYSSDNLSAVISTDDGGYILGGLSYSGIGGDKTEAGHSGDVWVVKIDSAGNILWQNTIGGSNGDGLFLQPSLKRTVDGGYILGAYSSSNISFDKTENCIGDQDYWVIKLDSLGTIQWQNTIGGSERDQTTSIINTLDGGYAVAGFSKSNISGDKTENNRDSTLVTSDYWIIKLDISGNIQWQKTFGGNKLDYLMCTIQDADGGYIMGGYSASGISGDKTDSCYGPHDFWIVKSDGFGNILWQKTFGGNESDYLHSIQQTSDGGYILGGTSRSDSTGDKTENSMGDLDYWVIKLFPDTITGIVNHQSSINNLQIFPNPSSGIFQITLPSSSNPKTNYTLEVINTLGQTVFASQPETRNQKPETTLNLSFLPKGIYVFKINDGVSALSSKFVIE